MGRVKSLWSVTYRGTSFEAVGELIMNKIGRVWRTIFLRLELLHCRVKRKTGDTWIKEPAARSKSVEKFRGPSIYDVKHAPLALNIETTLLDSFREKPTSGVRFELK